MDIAIQQLPQPSATRLIPNNILTTDIKLHWISEKTLWLHKMIQHQGTT